MRKVIPKNIADEMTQPYIDDAVEKQIKAADVPPRNKLNISFENTDRTDDNKEYKSNQEAYEKNHGKLYDMTHKNTIPWKNYVVYFVLLSLLTTVFTFSKYMSGGNFSGEAIIAKFDYVISGNELSKSDVKIIENNIQKIKDETYEVEDAKVFEFTVKNTSDVTIDVKPTCTSITGSNLKFDYLFYSDPDTANQISKARIESNKTGKIYLKVDVSKASTEVTEKFYLVFDVEQVD